MRISPLSGQPRASARLAHVDVERYPPYLLRMTRVSVGEPEGDRFAMVCPMSCRPSLG
jgi:hypothetical protein